MQATTNRGRTVFKFLALVGVLMFLVVIDSSTEKRQVESVIKEDESVHIKNATAVFDEGNGGLRGHQESPRNNDTPDSPISIPDIDSKEAENLSHDNNALVEDTNNSMTEKVTEETESHTNNDNDVAEDASDSFTEDTTTTDVDGIETEDHTLYDVAIEDKHDKEEAGPRTNITIPNVLLIGVQKGGTSAVSFQRFLIEMK